MTARDGRVKVCCFCETWESGGIESFLCNVISRMDLTAVRVDIVAAELRDSVFTAPLEALGVRFFTLSGHQRALGKNHRLFRVLLRREEYDVVHLNVFQALSLAYARDAQRAGVKKIIAHSHNTCLRASALKPLKLMLHYTGRGVFTRFAGELWACSEQAARFMFSPRRMKSQGWQFIPNGIDPERFRFDPQARARARAELGVGDRIVVGSVGRLCYQKNQAFLLDAFALYRRRRPDSVLLLVGEGEDREILVNKAQIVDISGSVLFNGVSDCVEHLMWAMDVFAMPSRFEGLGIVAIEAQTAGLPVIASEYIPPEANISDLFRTCPLSAGPEAWASAFAAACPAPMRERMPETSKRAGFDILDTAKYIQQQWMEKRDG